MTESEKWGVSWRRVLITRLQRMAAIVMREVPIKGLIVENTPDGLSFKIGPDREGSVVVNETFQYIVTVKDGGVATAASDSEALGCVWTHATRHWTALFHHTHYNTPLDHCQVSIPGWEASDEAIASYLAHVETCPQHQAIESVTDHLAMVLVKTQNELDVV